MSADGREQTPVDVGPRPGAAAGSRRSAARMAARDLRRHPWRTLLILLLIGLPVFAVSFGSVVVASTELPTAAEEREQLLWGYDGYLTQGVFSPDDLQSPTDLYGAVDAESAAEGLEAPAVDVAALNAAAKDWPVCLRGEGCSVQDAVPAGTEATLLSSGSGTLTVPGSSLDVRLVVADFTDEALQGPDRRFQLVQGALPGQGEVLASSGLMDELASARERATARGLEAGPTDRVELEIPKADLGGEPTQATESTQATELTLSGTLLDRIDVYPSALGLFQPMELWESVLYVQAGSETAQALFDSGFNGEAEVTAYLSGDVPDDYAAYRAYNLAGFSVLFKPVMLQPGPVQAAFEGQYSADGAWMILVPLLFVGVLALAEAGLLAGAAFAVGARQQRRSTALLSVTGAEPATLRQTMVFSGLWCGLVGAIGGALLGVAGGVGVVWAAQARHIPAYGPHVPWWPVVAAVVLGLVCAVVAAWIPARAVAGQNAWAAIKGATGERKPVSRPVLLTGLVLTAVGLLLALVASVVGMALPTLGALREALPWLAVALVASALLLLLGVLMLLPGTVTGVARLAGRLPVSLRIAARDAHRNRSRTVPVAAAVVAATAVGTAVLTSMALVEAGYETLDGSNARYGSPSPDTGYVWVQDHASIEKMLRQEALYSEDGQQPTAAEIGMYTGGASGAVRQLRAAEATPGSPRLVEYWEVHGAQPSCEVLSTNDCSELMPLYPQDSPCRAPVPTQEIVDDRRVAVDEAMYAMTRAEAAACGAGGAGGGGSGSLSLNDPMSTLMVVDTLRPETVPAALFGGDAEAMAAVQSGKALVFDPQYLDGEGRFTVGQFATDVDRVPGVSLGEEDRAWFDEMEADGDPIAGKMAISAAQGRNTIWEPERTRTLDAVEAPAPEGDHPIAIIPVTALAGMDQEMALDGVLARFAEPVTTDQVSLVNDLLSADDLWLSSMAQSAGDRFPVQWLVAGLVGLLVISVAGLTTGLALADARRDHAVLSSVGAPPGTRKSMAAAQTFTGALLGTALGVPVGAIAVVGIGLIDLYSAAWIPWPQLAVLVLGVPVLAAVLTWLVVPGRLPVREADRN
ncbi:FtsX-like permease family protein [Microbacterium sp. A93]|uniref:FtsX-like permease family protein n=1 Tax=Microbacterium sp. A93 TaxID=3450716 RepID=UPI003F41BA6B